jgi:nicotinate dehydrogenase subunit A
MPTIRVNGQPHEVQAAPDTPLLYVLRNDLQLNGPKFGCGLGQCGACTVHLGGVPVRACMTPVSAALQQPVVTIEGLGTPHAPHPLQTAFIDEQAGQCGYCLSGMIMTAAALLAKTPRPTESQLRDALGANLCRCGSHLRILRAIRRVTGSAAPATTKTAAATTGAAAPAPTKKTGGQL